MRKSSNALLFLSCLKWTLEEWKVKQDGGESDHLFSRMFGGMTKQEVTSLGDCSALAHYEDNPSWQSVPPGPGRPRSLL